VSFSMTLFWLRMKKECEKLQRMHKTKFTFINKNAIGLMFEQRLTKHFKNNIL